MFGKQKEPFQQASSSLGACEVDTGISCLGFSYGVHLVDRVGNSCLRHTKVSLLGLTVSVSVQRKESILLDYGCALSVKQPTCSVWHVSRWFVAEPLVWSVSRSCCVTALCCSSPLPPFGGPRLPTPALWCLILYSGTEAGVLPYSYLSLNKSHLRAQSAQSDLGFNKGSEGQWCRQDTVIIRKKQLKYSERGTNTLALRHG